MERTEWILRGEHFEQSSGPRPSFFEEKLPESFLISLPEANQLDGAQFSQEEKPIGDSKMSCITIVPKAAAAAKNKLLFGVFPTYCFTPAHAILRAATTFAGSLSTFNSIVRFQGKVLSREVTTFAGARRVMTANIEELSVIPGDVPEFAPLLPQRRHPRSRELNPALA